MSYSRCRHVGANATLGEGPGRTHRTEQLILNVVNGSSQQSASTVYEDVAPILVFGANDASAFASILVQYGPDNDLVRRHAREHDTAPL